MNSTWPTKSHAVASLHLDKKNPRLGREKFASAPRQIIQYLFDHDKAMDVAVSIARSGFFANEPLLAIKEDGRLVVIEGNRRLAALKALREPGLLEGPLSRQVERLARSIPDQSIIINVPVTIAPSRRATDRLLAGRHVGTPVLPWQAENRASFILDKLEEGYTNDELRDQLGFTTGDIQSARQTRAVAEMARSLDLPEDVRAKLDSPRAKVFTTLERVFDSSIGRKYLQVEADPEHGIRGTTTKAEFVRVFKKLVTDVALKKQSSRSLNTNENIQAYFESWPSDDQPQQKRGTFVPAEVITGRSVASPARPARPVPAAKKSQQLNRYVLPRDFKVRVQNARLIDIRRELVGLDRERFPNAGAVLLRVFLELSVLDYLKRSGHLEVLTKRLAEKGKLRYGTPEMRELAPEIVRIAKKRLSAADAQKVEKALKYDASAPFSISQLHAFIHQADLPSQRDILQFWLRTEPLFRMMLEQDLEQDDHAD